MGWKWEEMNASASDFVTGELLIRTVLSPGRDIIAAAEYMI